MAAVPVANPTVRTQGPDSKTTEVNITSDSCGGRANLRTRCQSYRPGAGRSQIQNPPWSTAPQIHAGPNSKSAEVNSTSDSPVSRANRADSKRASCTVKVATSTSIRAQKDRTKERSGADCAAWSYRKCCTPPFFTAVVGTVVCVSAMAAASVANPTIHTQGPDSKPNDVKSTSDSGAVAAPKRTERKSAQAPMVPLGRISSALCSALFRCQGGYRGMYSSLPLIVFLRNPPSPHPDTTPSTVMPLRSTSHLTISASPHSFEHTDADRAAWSHLKCPPTFTRVATWIDPTVDVVRAYRH
ncbi:hypothetical protein V500_02413 [Pseudogymnoascus sp. VKM F-4518 (FW-2643)]|nr:hypothetical protein V500_02413 [Pseudogymnoascus sp. VKM F-4518 (FW-2643)]